MYRRLLFTIHGYSSKGIMPSGILCNVEDPTIDETHGDVVHPCVRFIKPGFEGHKWWMVYTPYYGENSKLENPRLCYADVSEDELPVKWNYYCTIVDLPEKGYNSDPTVLYDNGQLYVFWRENHTQRASDLGCSRITVGCKVHSRQISYLSDPQLKEVSISIDREVSPTIIKTKSSYRAYAIHMNFVPNYITRLPSIIGSKLYRLKLVFLLDALGICDMNKNYGVAVWESPSLENSFHYLRTIGFQNSSNLYQPWHMDLFESDFNEDNGLYAVVQSRQRHARICLARSDDGNNFYFYKKPLLTSKTIGMTGLYKPSAVQVGNRLYLFYTVHNNRDRNLNQLFVTFIDWESLLGKITE